ncbi:uncharacterized protein [Leptinotarsa decemlineata]|uniref:uncharacterized protein n=1 Tax=Leptinotarsa decemlineata TaxID=7539 RepID=UPI000C254BD1|nr:myb-like protein X [Leptinotarsa decemlineata]XP_023029779.1 myb-like protein X [Leptinotarsa decemlineata]
MQSSKIRKVKGGHSKKEIKLSKLIKNDSDSEGTESEHELSHYLNDRVKMMKEVLKIIKPKKIRTMAPDCMQKLDNEEINSMLLDELLGISNKRLKYIFSGQNLNEESSSTDPEEEQPIDVISLDEISDDEFVIDLDSDKESRPKHHRKHKTKVKDEPKKKRVKKEKRDVSAEKSKDSSKNQMSEQNLMSVLELLELQARARAIRSQLALESTRKAEEAAKAAADVESSDNEDAVIVESPKNLEIIITSSDSENENSHVESGQHNQNNQVKGVTGDERSCKEAEDTAHEPISVEAKTKVPKENPSKGTLERIEKDRAPAGGNGETCSNNQTEEVADIPHPEGGENNQSDDGFSKKNNGWEAPMSDSSTSKTLQGVEVRNERGDGSRSEKNVDGSTTDSNPKKIVAETQVKDKKDKKSRICRRKLSKLARRKMLESDIAVNSLSTEKNIEKSRDKQGDESAGNFLEKSRTDEGEGIILNVEQSEMDCIHLD